MSEENYALNLNVKFIKLHLLFKFCYNSFILLYPLGFKCNQCLIVLTSMEALLNHKKTHCNEGSQNRFKCNFCPYSTNFKSCMKTHSVVHTGQRPYRCEVCNNGFTQLHSLKRHMLIHTDQRPYTCDMCNMSFRHTHHFKRHMRKHLQL